MNKRLTSMKKDTHFHEEKTHFHEERDSLPWRKKLTSMKIIKFVPDCCEKANWCPSTTQQIEKTLQIEKKTHFHEVKYSLPWRPLNSCQIAVRIRTDVPVPPNKWRKLCEKKNIYVSTLIENSACNNNIDRKLCV